MPAPQSSPHLQSPNSRQVFASAMQGNRPRASVIEMPPPSPSPHYSPRPVMQSQGGQSSRPPLYSRVPYLHSPRQQTASPSDPYASSPMTPQPTNDPYAHPPNTPRPVISENENFPVSNEPYQKIMTETYSSTPPGASELEMTAGMSSPRPQPPQGQETRQHLRDLLQRQQIKKLEQDQMSPGRNELSSPGTPRPVSWSSGTNSAKPFLSSVPKMMITCCHTNKCFFECSDEWQKAAPLDQNYGPRQLNSPSSPQIQQQNQFRHPFLPPQSRLSGQAQQATMPGPNRALGSEFRGPQPNVQQSAHSLDPRFRLLLQQQQQQRLISPQQQVGNRPQMNFAMGHQQQLQHGPPQSSQQQHQMNHQTQFRPAMSVRNPLDPYDHLVTQQRSGVGLPPGKKVF